MELSNSSAENEPTEINWNRFIQTLLVDARLSMRVRRISAEEKFEFIKPGRRAGAHLKCYASKVAENR